MEEVSIVSASWPDASHPLEAVEGTSFFLPSRLLVNSMSTYLPVHMHLYHFPHITTLAVPPGSSQYTKFSVPCFKNEIYNMLH